MAKKTKKLGTGPKPRSGAKTARKLIGVARRTVKAMPGAKSERSNRSRCIAKEAVAASFPQAYVGDLEVIDGDFTIDFRRLIFREGNVIFDIAGHDEYGHFKTEGVAFPAGDGIYRSLRTAYVIVGTSLTRYAVLELTSLQRRGKRLHVVGKWCEGGDEFHLKGELNGVAAV